MSTKTCFRPPSRQLPFSRSIRRGRSLAVAVCAAIGLAFGALPAHGAEPDNLQPPSASEAAQPRQGSTLPFDAKRLGLLKPVTVLFDKKVIDTQNKTVGKMKDFVLDLSSGQILVALVYSSGKAPITPVPAHSFEAVRRDKAELNATRKLFESAPRFPLASTDGHWDTSILADSFLFFNQPAPCATAGSFCGVAGLVGQPLLSQANEALGQVQDIAIDLPGGRALYLVIEPGPGLNSLDDLYLVPPASVHPGNSGRTLILDASRDHFLAGHHFPKAFPSDMVFPEVASAVYQHYGLLPESPAKSATAPVSTPLVPDAKAAPAQSSSGIIDDQAVIDAAVASFDLTLPLQ